MTNVQEGVYTYDTFNPCDYGQVEPKNAYQRVCVVAESANSEVIGFETAV